MAEECNIPQGKITIGFSNKKLSIGVLELNPGQALEKHSRPVKEQLFQVRGVCIIKIFYKGNKIRESVLKEGSYLKIPANQFHIHSNPTSEKTLTLWKFQGDISEIIRKIRESSKK
ncbi:MAG: hypothetical protein EPN86_05395 [Nanoarchaeota archaeon]|nr:MAG: hypothetical protein EPN86_05395 [Nanoarchaeota archaeon]